MFVLLFTAFPSERGENGEKIPIPEWWQIPSHSFPCFGYRFIHALFRHLKGCSTKHAGMNQESTVENKSEGGPVLCEKSKTRHEPDWKWCCVHSELDLLKHLAIVLVVHIEQCASNVQIIYVVAHPNRGARGIERNTTDRQ